MSVSLSSFLSHNTMPLFDEQRFSHRLSIANDPLPIFIQALAEADEQLATAFDNGVAVERLVRGRAQVLDLLLTQAWTARFRSRKDLALIAVGGYGRGELHPYSDIDLLILHSSPLDTATEAKISSFLSLLWDMRLDVGHSVRTLEESEQACREEITICTNLIESRRVAGNMELFRQLRALTRPSILWSSLQFFKAKLSEQKARHKKYHGTAYRLEPNIKESPGGLRDLQNIGWVAKRHFQVDSLEKLVEQGFLTEQEYRRLMQGQEMLWRIRFALHRLTGRKEDRLLFEHQRALAVQLGYSGPGNRAVEAFMQDYYRSVMEIERLNEMLLQHFREVILFAHKDEQPRILNTRFHSCHGYLEVRNAGVFAHYPPALLEIFLCLARNPDLKGVRASTIRLVREHLHLIDERFRRDPINRDLFMEILRQPRGVTHQLRRMNRYGVLAAYLPAFAQIVGRMQFDLFHVYTVDEHTLFIIRNLRRFAVPDHRNEFPLCSQIMENFERPELLYLAGLFHDIAKGRGGDHSELGAEEALNFCQHHGIDTENAKLVAWLVRNHLLMSMTAQKRDISDPQVIAAFSHQLGNQKRLDYLFLLTVADIRATNPELWNDWRHTLLTQLYRATLRHLQGNREERGQLRDDRLARARQRAREVLRSANFSNGACEGIERLWSHFGPEYFLQYDPAQILWHCRTLLAAVTETQAQVDMRTNDSRAVTEIFIYTPDRPHIFASASAVLERLGLNVVEAQIHTTDDGFTVDTFFVLEGRGTVIDDEFRLHEIKDALIEALSQPKEAGLVNRRQTRGQRIFTVDTKLEYTQEDRRTALHLLTADRPGLLSRIGSVFINQQVRLQKAKIATLGERADDVFYITDLDATPLREPERLDTLRQEILEVLENMSREG